MFQTVSKPISGAIEWIEKKFSSIISELEKIDVLESITGVWDEIVCSIVGIFDKVAKWVGDAVQTAINNLTFGFFGANKTREEMLREAQEEADKLKKYEEEQRKKRESNVANAGVVINGKRYLPGQMSADGIVPFIGEKLNPKDQKENVEQNAPVINTITDASTKNVLNTT